MSIYWIIADPNGAGKTTSALDFLLLIGCRHFINADVMSAGLNPINPDAESFRASKIYWKEINQNSQLELRLRRVLYALVKHFPICFPTAAQLD